MMDFIKKVFTFINISIIFTITTIGLRLFLVQVDSNANQIDCSYVELYLRSNVPGLTMLFLLAGITAIAINVFSKWNFKLWLKINLYINVLILSVLGVCFFFYYTSLGVKLIAIPLIVVYMALYAIFKSMLSSGYKIHVVYANEGTEEL